LIINSLLEAGADINAMNKYGETPLDRADEDGYADVAQVLVEYYNTHGIEIPHARKYNRLASRVTAAIDREAAKYKLENDMCPICLVSAQELNKSWKVSHMPCCGHFICTHCIHIMQFKESACPLCRAPYPWPVNPKR
jgi:ankyrin repeat protein